METNYAMNNCEQQIEMTESEALAAAQELDPETLYIIAFDCEPLMQELKRIVIAKRIELEDENLKKQLERLQVKLLTQNEEVEEEGQEGDAEDLEAMRQRLQYEGIPFPVFDHWQYAYTFRGYCIFLHRRARNAMSGADEKGRCELRELAQEALRLLDLTEIILRDGFSMNLSYLKEVQLGLEWRSDLNQWMRRN